MPYLSALEVCSRQGAMQIHVYLHLYLTMPWSPCYIWRRLKIRLTATTFVAGRRSQTHNRNSIYASHTIRVQHATCQHQSSFPRKYAPTYTFRCTTVRPKEQTDDSHMLLKIFRKLVKAINQTLTLRCLTLGILTSAIPYTRQTRIELFYSQHLHV